MFTIDAYRSCIPDLVGCRVCSRDGYRPHRGVTLSGPEMFQKGGFALEEGGLDPTWRFKWEVTCAALICNIGDKEGLVAEFSSEDVRVEESPYVVTLKISSDTESSSAAPITINVINRATIDTSCEIPAVAIRSRSAKMGNGRSRGKKLYCNRGRRENVLVADLSGRDGTELEQADGDKYNLEWTMGSVVVGRGPVLVVPNSLLVEASGSLTFTLYARQDCSTGSDPFAQIVIDVNQPPSGGSFHVVPLSGVPMTTKVSSLSPPKK